VSTPNFVPRERFGNETIIYAGDYLETDHEYFPLPKDDCCDGFTGLRNKPEF
jgi:hypothetical protein